MHFSEILKLQFEKESLLIQRYSCIVYEYAGKRKLNECY